MLRDVDTAARQWAVASTEPARDAFAMACLVVADAVDAQTAEEERDAPAAASPRTCPPRTGRRSPPRPAAT